MSMSDDAAANAAQIEFWNNAAGLTWAECQAQLDRQLAILGAAAMRSLAPAAGERILDIGCGCGETSYALAERVGATGAVLGVDISEPMLAVARQRSGTPGSATPDFLQADAQTADLGEAGFDAVFSRFGVMFFNDPAAAFANIRRALKPGGRLAFVCWRPMAENPWMRVPMEAALPLLPPQPPADPTAPGPFAFADSERVRGILDRSWFQRRADHALRCADRQRRSRRNSGLGPPRRAARPGAARKPRPCRRNRGCCEGGPRRLCDSQGRIDAGRGLDRHRDEQLRPFSRHMPASGVSPMAVHIPFDNSYARLPDRFFARLNPTPVAAPRLIKVNTALAELLGIDPAALASAEGVAILAGNQVAEGSEPLAQAYAGHQFGGFSPQLGDGRAILLGEVVGLDGQRRDIQLKGSGPTPFSRRGDGRAALGPVLREYIISEAMAALGVPTTRALAAVTTGEAVRRETMLPGGVFTRVAASHIRVGTFQYFAARGDGDGVRILADHAIARHYPAAAEDEKPYRAFLDGVIARQAELIAQWLHIGFIHGVMNTDNTAISGETIDFGPCAFMDGYDSRAVFSSIDYQGRYAYGNQPNIAFWNLTRLAEAILPLIAEDEEAAIAEAKEALAAFAPRFQAAYDAGLRRKIGLTVESEDNTATVHALLTLMAEQSADFTLTFRGLCDAVLGPEGDAAMHALFATSPAAFDGWAARWRQRLAEEPGTPEARRAAMRAVNPAFIPRNHQVEAAITAAVSDGDFSPFEALNAVLSRPYEDQPGAELYALPPKEEERVLQTFCGT